MAKKNRATRAGTCKQAASLISDYLTGALAPEITTELERHLGVCPDCVAFLKTYKKTIQATQSLLLSGIFPELGPSRRQALHQSIVNHSERG